SGRKASFWIVEQAFVHPSIWPAGGDARGYAGLEKLVVPAGPMAAGISRRVVAVRHRRRHHAGGLCDSGFPGLCGTGGSAAASRRIRLSAGRNRVCPPRLIASARNRTDSAISLMIAGTVGAMAEGDVQRYAQIASLAAFTVAVLCLLGWL